jgi:hypothetical protein
MKKSDKKLENTLLKALSEVCEQALDEIDGFKWLTHRVSYSNFPASLLISCNFQSKDDYLTAQLTEADEALRRLIQHKLGQQGIPVKDSQVAFGRLT